MSFLTGQPDLSTHLLPSLLLAFVAAIPNHTVRYSALAFLVIVSGLCTIHLKLPLSQLRELASMIDETDEQLRSAMAQCPRNCITLTEQMGQLLQTNKSASQIKCRILASEGAWWYHWKKYRALSNDITACAGRIRTVRTAIQVN
ncbi:hypothetical protein C8R45DRAFT_1112577 [Mycena sanguinolenta]|nr:hypothetical protein C8R45DRAFT_1112577 [Mycena sanguinolenta]